MPYTYLYAYLKLNKIDVAISVSFLFNYLRLNSTLKEYYLKLLVSSSPRGWRRQGGREQGAREKDFQFPSSPCPLPLFLFWGSSPLLPAPFPLSSSNDNLPVEYPSDGLHCSSRILDDKNDLIVFQKIPDLLANVWDWGHLTDIKVLCVKLE